MGWDYNSHIVCMCIIMRWSRNRSANWAERFRTSSLLCTYKLCDYYSPIPILSAFLFTPSLYAPILNLQDFSFTCTCTVCSALCSQKLLKYIITCSHCLRVVAIGYEYATGCHDIGNVGLCVCAKFHYHTHH